jgi:dual specificity MAP kinase phosphatase
MEAKAIDETGIFRIFTACPNDPKTLLLDVRPHKAYKKCHINQAYCVRLSSNGKVLADYSQSSYSLPWSQHCW